LRRQLVAQGAVADALLRVRQDGVRFRRSIQRPEQIARRRQRDRRTLAVAPGVRAEIGEQPLRLRATSRGGQRPPERQPRVDAAARVHRRLREPLGQGRIRRGQALPGRGRE
jgi:hypothetical protein